MSPTRVFNFITVDNYLGFREAYYQRGVAGMTADDINKKTVKIAGITPAGIVTALFVSTVGASGLLQQQQRGVGGQLSCGI